MKHLLILGAFVACVAAPAALRAQGSEDYTGGITIKLNEGGTKSIRFITWLQMWARYYETNPNTLLDGRAVSNFSDIGIRRARALWYSQISPRYLVLLHLGINNQTFNSGGVPGGGVTGNGGTGQPTLGKKTGLFFHDFWNEYAVILPKKKDGTARNGSLYVGTGLHYWNGISRLTSASTLNFLSVDAPIINWPLVDLSDQFVRQFGIYVKGKVGKLDYRFAANKPFRTNLTPVAEDIAVDNNNTDYWAHQGYVMYQFLDQESNLLPFTVGTYLGTKKVFNLGAGFYRAPQQTATLDPDDGVSLNRHGMTLWAADVFADIPFGGSANWAFTGYGAYYNYEMGPNYLRSLGLMSPAFTADPAGDPDDFSTTAPTGNLVGIARPFVGTGSFIYAEAGLLLPKMDWMGKHRLQPFIEGYTQRLEALDDNTLTNWAAGVNWLIDGHHAKVTFRYGTRPLVRNNEQDGSRGEFLIQTQVYL